MSSNSPAAHLEAAPALAAQLRATLSRLKRRLREQGGREDLTTSQVAVLFRLEQSGPATVSALARAEAMRPQSMSAIVTALQQSGMVTGIPDPDDGRKTLIALSPKYRKRLQQARIARQDWLTAAILQKLSSREQQQLAASLHLLNRLTEDSP